MIKQSKGITLIALVITIIILLILAGVSISTLGGENGLFARAKQAKEETQISNYKEQIELIKANLQIQNEDYKSPTIAQLKEEFDTNHKKWVSSTEIITDNGKEKLKLTTKEGYIFYITESTTEYKGKGKVIDTSALQRDDVIKLEITQETESGKLVQITNLSSQNYYKIKYQINSTEGEWQDIKSGNEVEVPYGGTIYAKLIYGSNSGIVHRLSVENSEPKVVAKEIDLSNLTRKTEISIADLFEKTWGSDGTGTIEYIVSGNLLFNNTSFNSTEIENIRDLELGTYTVTCKVISPSNQTVTATKKNVKIATLANTTVANASNENVQAKAIYSEYDLAYFRDLVNGGQTSINGKMMNDIDLANVCSASVGSWYPIGGKNTSVPINGIDDTDIYYNGFFDGNSKELSHLYINSSTLYRQALFSILKENGVIQNVTVEGNIKGYRAVSGIVALNSKGKISNCINKAKIEGSQMSAGIVANNEGDIQNCTNEQEIKSSEYQAGGICGRNSGSIKNSYNFKNSSGGYLIGGICGENEDGATIDSCYNIGEVNSNGATLKDGDTGELREAFAGGIVGHNYGIVTKCLNEGEVLATYRVNGGIAGRNLNTITYCCNSGNVTGELVNGGIVGNNRGYISYVYNIAELITSTLSNEGGVGGIAGNQNTTSGAYIKYAYNKANCTGSDCIGGIIGGLSIGTISNAYNIGTISGATNVGQVYGYTYSTSAVTNSGYTTETDMISWNQTTITSKIGAFTKKTNNLPILNITVNDIIF